MRLLPLLLLFLVAPVVAHQWTPTYFAWRPSHVDGVLTTSLMLWNNRAEIGYYEIQVLDGNMMPVKFVTNTHVIQVPYRKRKTVNVYINANDKGRAVYVCSRSRSISDETSRTVVSSRICSKAKGKDEDLLYSVIVD